MFSKICKFGSFAYSKCPPKWANHAPSSILSCLQSTVFIVWVSNFHIYLCVSSPWTYVNLVDLHIQYGHQNGWILPRTAYLPVCRPHCLLHWSQIFICISSWGLPATYVDLASLHFKDGRQNGRFMLLTSYFAVCSPQFLLHWSQIPIFIYAWVLPQICKFCSFAYSIWLPKWPNYVWNR